VFIEQLANLVALQPAKFLTPPIIRDFGDAYRANRVSNSSSSTDRGPAAVSFLRPMAGKLNRNAGSSGPAGAARRVRADRMASTPNP
jgi:hypothetical protein